MFGLGLPELIIIFVIALLVFGPKKLPDLGKSVGRAMSEFKKAQQDFQESVQTEMKAVEKTANLQEVKELGNIDLKAYEEADAGTAAVERKTDPEPEHKQQEASKDGEAKANG